MGFMECKLTSCGKLKGLVFTGLAFLALFLILEVASTLKIISPVIFPAPSTILSTFPKIQDILAQSILTTSYHMALCYFLGGVLGIILGVYTAHFAILERTLGKLITSIFPIPRLTYLPLFILWFGLTDIVIIMISTISVFFAVFMNTFAGVKKIPPEYLYVCKNLGGDRGDMLRMVIFPASVPFIIAGLRYGIGKVLSSVIVTEMIIGQSGIGGMFWRATNLFKPEVTVLLEAIIVVAGLLLFSSFDWAERRMFPWMREVNDNVPKS